MSTKSNDLPDSPLPGNTVLPFEVAQRIETLKAGGVIERALSAPEQSMDKLIDRHLSKVAEYNARGDTKSERPFYIFNPDTNLLINYSYRRGNTPEATGLFADVVELDEEGKPRHGVSVVDPFATVTGFLNVEVGENGYGLPSSHATFNVESDDPLQSVPPNIEMAQLMALVGLNQINLEESLEDFVARRKEEREEWNRRVEDYSKKNIPPNFQSITPTTNPDLHLIISDNDDTDTLAAASREVGLFPVVITGEQVIDHLKSLYKNIPREKFAILEVNSVWKLMQRYYPQLGDWLKDNNPAMLTVNMTDKGHLDPGHPTGWRHVTVKHAPGEGGVSKEGELPIQVFLDMFLAEVAQSEKTFSKLVNIRESPYDIEEWDGYPDPGVRKIGHGSFEYPLKPSDPEIMKNYEDWLRKSKLDLALTMYVRGLNSL